MADQSDVERVLVGMIGAALYPQGTQAPSVVGSVVRVYRGWPTPASLDQDLAAGAVNVTVFPELAGQVNTTRWLETIVPTAVRDPTLTATVSGIAVTIGGSPGVGQVVGLRVDNIAVVHRIEAGDTSEQVAAVLGAYLRATRIVNVTGATVSIPGASSVVARVVADQDALAQTRRQRQNFRISCWCPDPSTRDAIGGAIDSALSSRTFVGLPDGLSGRLRFVSSIVVDRAQEAALYRRDLIYSVDYATTVAVVTPTMIFGASKTSTAPGSALKTVLS